MDECETMTSREMAPIRHVRTRPYGMRGKNTRLPLQERLSL